MSRQKNLSYVAQCTDPHEIGRLNVVSWRVKNNLAQVQWTCFNILGEFFFTWRCSAHCYQNAWHHLHHLQIIFKDCKHSTTYLYVIMRSNVFAMMIVCLSNVKQTLSFQYFILIISRSRMLIGVTVLSHCHPVCSPSPTPSSASPPFAVPFYSFSNGCIFAKYSR